MKRVIRQIVALLAVGAGVAGASAQSTIYNTGYSVHTNGLGQLVDNLWNVTQVQNLPSGLTVPGTPYGAFSYPTPPVWDNSAPPVGANGGTTTWDSISNPLFAGVDTGGMISTYTLNFSAAAGAYKLFFEADNYVSIYLGAVTPANLIYTEASGNDFLAWQNILVNIAADGNYQLNVLVYNSAVTAGGNYTGWRANFSTANVSVPEPSSLALATIGAGALLAAAKRRRAK